MIAHDNVVAAHDIVIAVDALSLQRVHDLLNAGEFQRVTGLQTDLLARQRIHAVMQHQLKTLESVEIAGSGTSFGSASAGMRLDASHDAPVSCVLKRGTLVEHHRHSHSVAEKRGVRLSVLVHLHTLVDQAVRRFVADTQTDRGGLKLHTVRGFQH